jgi:hypothetical protein
MSILEERGLFWWHGEPILDKHFAPEASVLGLLKISDEGVATLELDGDLPSNEGTFGVLSRDREALKGRLIEGLLTTSAKHVLLIEIHRYGGTFSSNNLSHGGYRSTHCLINYSYFPAIDELSLFNSPEIDLAGYEEWLWLNSIETFATDNTISVEYKKRNPSIYAIDEGTVTVEYNISGVGKGKWLDRNISLIEKAALVYDSNTHLTLAQMWQKFREFEDLLLIITNSDYNLSWPNISISVGDDNRWFEWYYFRRKSVVDAPRAHECITNFSKIEYIFGTVLSNWLRKRQGVGPGFYLYLGFRRSAPIYVENRFVTLITGLEALHRKIKNDAGERGVKEKVVRIIASVIDKKDKKWLTNRLKNAHEPNLEKRLFDLFTSVDLHIDKKRLRLFASQCSMIRNDLSHFGEQRNGIEYQAFIRDVTNKNEALSIIYHMIILREIGIDENMIRDWIYNRSFSAEAYLVEANLLDKRVPQQAKPSAPITDR